MAEPRQLPAFNKTDRERISRLAGLGLTQDMIAHVFDCHTDTLRAHCAEELATGKSKTIAVLAERAYARALENDTMLMFVLKTQGKWQEVQRHEMAGHDGGPLTINVNVVPSSE